MGHNGFFGKIVSQKSPSSPDEKTFHKDLVDDRSAHPRNFPVHVPRVDVRTLKKIEVTETEIVILRHAVFGKIIGVPLRLDAENIGETGILQAHLHDKIVEQPVRIFLAHGTALPADGPVILHRVDELDLLRVPFRHAETDHQFVVGNRKTVIGLDGMIYGLSIHCLSLVNGFLP